MVRCDDTIRKVSNDNNKHVPYNIREVFAGLSSLISIPGNIIVVVSILPNQIYVYHYSFLHKVTITSILQYHTDHNSGILSEADMLSYVISWIAPSIAKRH